MDRDMFDALAENAHTTAEACMRLQDCVVPMFLLYDRQGEMTTCPVVGDLDDGRFSYLRRVVRDVRAVAAVRISEGMELPLPPGAGRLPSADLPDPGESPDARRVIVSEARWPWARMHQVRRTGVDRDADGALVLRRIPGDPDGVDSRNDLLAHLFPPVRKS
jgi:hypothetical protein